MKITTCRTGFTAAWPDKKEFTRPRTSPRRRPLRIWLLNRANASREETMSARLECETHAPPQGPFLNTPPPRSSGLDPWEIQGTLNALLNLSLEQIPLDEFLQRALRQCLGIPGLFSEPTGAIFLANEEEKALVLRARTGEYPQHCARVPFGYCLCGSAALEQQALYAACMDGRHTLGPERQSDHGHYCLPIKFGNRTLGVFLCYLRAGHLSNPEEMAYLTSVSDILANVIERKRNEDARAALARQNQLLKMNATLGVFAGMIGHDIKNYLFFEKKLSEVLDDPLRKHPGIIKGIERARRMAQGMKDLTMPSNTAPQTFCVDEMAAAQVAEFQSLFGEHCQFRMFKGLDIPPLTSVEQLLSRVLCNLLMNAYHATENRPDSISIPSYVILTVDPAEGGVLISVEDNAGGIGQRTLGYMESLFQMVHDAYHDQGHLFDVVDAISRMEGFTNGVGLFFTAVAVHDMSGTISVTSTPGQGSTFQIWLPERITALKKLLRF